MRLELVFGVHQRQTFVSLRLPNEIDLFDEAFENRAARRDDVAQAFHFVRPQMRFLDELRRALRGGIER
jgi:hypothetical protein